MKKGNKALLTGLLTLVVCLVIGLTIRVTSANVESIDAEDALSVITNANLLMVSYSNFDNGILTIDNIKAMESKETNIEKSQFQINYNNKIDQYYSTQSKLSSVYKESYASYINYTGNRGYNIKSGNLLSVINSFNKIDDNHCQIEVTLIPWQKRLEYNGDNYVSWICVNKTNLKANMIKENSTWKIVDYSKFDVSFSPPEFNIGEKTYPTLEEAYNGIINFSITNPFNNN